jgi:hypothetical protein
LQRLEQGLVSEDAERTHCIPLLGPLAAERVLVCRVQVAEAEFAELGAPREELLTRLEAFFEVRVMIVGVGQDVGED